MTSGRRMSTKVSEATTDQLLKTLKAQLEILEKLYSLNLTIKWMLDRGELQFLQRLYEAKKAVLEELDQARAANHEKNEMLNRAAMENPSIHRLRLRIQAIAQKIVELDVEIQKSAERLTDQDVQFDDERSKVCESVNLI